MVNKAFVFYSLLSSIAVGILFSGDFAGWLVGLTFFVVFLIIERIDSLLKPTKPAM